MPGRSRERAGHPLTLEAELTPEILQTPTPFHGSPLARAYVEGDDGALSFYPHQHTDVSAYEAKLDELRRRFSPADLERAAGFVRPSASGASGGSSPLDRLPTEGGAFVVTGQQPGLFGGPLYTLYKAVTAVSLARDLTERLGVPVVPLFWVASEDHDWDEVRRVHLLDPGNELRTAAVDPPDGGGREGPAPPFHRVPVGPDLNAALEGFLEALPETEFAAPFTELLHSAYRGGRALNESFADLLQGLPGLEDLCVVDAAHEGLKESMLPRLLDELEASEESEGLLRERAEELEAAGHPVQVPVLPGGVNLFLDGPQGRERLFRDPERGAFRLRHSDQPLSADDVRARAREDPRALSPNVLLRPVAESAALPVVASVTGPGELAYFAQLQPLFRRHGIGMPVVHPRMAAFLVEKKVAKVLDKFHLEVEDLAKPRHEVEGRIARDEIPGDVAAALTGIRQNLGEGTSELEKAAREVDSTLGGAVDRARRQAFHAFEEAEKKILQGVKRRDEVALGQLAKAQRNLYPEGHPQERVLSPFYFLYRYGPDFAHRLGREADSLTLRKPRDPKG